MNDFTKDELFEILGLASNAYGVKGRAMPIIIKLQSMIDNFNDLTPCNHKEIITGGYPRANPPTKCDICGAMYR